MGRAGAGFTQAFQGRGRPVGVTGDDQQARTLARQRQGGGLADPGRGAGDHRDLAFEHHRTPLRRRPRRCLCPWHKGMRREGCKARGGRGFAR